MRRPAPARRAAFVRAAAIAATLVPLALGAQGGRKREAPTPPDTVQRDVIYWAGAAQAAGRAGNHAEYLRLARKVRELAPTHPGVLHLVARAFALAGEPDSALATLDRLARLGDSRSVDSDSAFRALSASPRFGSVTAALAANRRPIERSAAAFEVPDPDLLPEAMAYDPTDGAFFVGSLARRKVIRVARDGSTRDFAGPAGDILGVVGVKLDAPRNRLWFASWTPGIDSASAPARRVDRTRLFAYDARTGARLLSLAPRDSLHAHLLNDLAITKSGDVYVTDTGHDAVYRVRAGVDTLELFVRPGPERFTGANGIALSGDERRLYVAFIAGIAAIDLDTRKATYLTMPPDVTTANVDGLAWHRGGLIAVQTVPSLERIVRFELDASGLRVTRAEVLERAHPAWRKPTTGVVVADTFFYVSSASYDRQSDDGKITSAATPGPTQFRRLDLGARVAAASPDSGWLSLFDGKTLRGWRGLGSSGVPATHWVVDGGAIRKVPSGRVAKQADGQPAVGGDLMTEGTYRDFELTWEWKVAPGANSGVKYDVSESLSMSVPPPHAAKGFEYQILDDDRHEDGKLPSHRAGALYDLIAPNDRKRLRPVGEWNRSRIVLVGNHGEHWLNGELVVSYDLGTPRMDSALVASKYRSWPWFADRRAGHIVLQDHGDEVWFRDIRIRPVENVRR